MDTFTPPYVLQSVAESLILQVALKKKIQATYALRLVLSYCFMEGNPDVSKQFSILHY